MPFPEWFINNGSPTNAREGESDPTSIFLLVGIISTNWEMLDEEMVSVMTRLVSRAHGGKVNLGSVISILASQPVAKARFSLISNQVDVVFQLFPQQREKYQNIFKKLDKALRLRNNVIHGVVRINQNLPEGLQYFLQPPTYKASKIKPWSGEPDNHDWFGPRALDFQYNAQILQEILEVIIELKKEISTVGT